MRGGWEGRVESEEYIILQARVASAASKIGARVRLAEAINGNAVEIGRMLATIIRPSKRTTGEGEEGLMGVGRGEKR